MSRTTDTSLSPAYTADLRKLIGRAFGPFEVGLRDPQPYGPISRRIDARKSDGDLPLPSAGSARASGSGPESAIYPKGHLPLVLSEAGYVVGPLLELASADIDPNELRAYELALLDTWDRYQRVLLPEILLEQLRKAAVLYPHRLVPLWLDHAATRVMEAVSVEEALARRRHLRMDAVRRGARGFWGDYQVAVAELMTDHLVVSRAARADMDRAALLAAGESNGSVSLALGRLEEQQATEFERVMSALGTPALTYDEFPPAQRQPLVAFAAARRPHFREGLLPDEPPAPEQAESQGSDRPASATSTGSADSPAPKTGRAPAPESARDVYRRLHSELRQRIVEPDDGGICSRLALAGVAHLNGVRGARILLIGRSGSGKTHAAKSLAEVLGIPHIQLDMSDATATGWRGVDVPSLLGDFAARVGDDFERAMVIMDEADKLRMPHGIDDGPAREAKINLQNSVLALLAGQVVTPDDGTNNQLRTQGLLIIGTASFDDSITTEPVPTDLLVHYGFSIELSARWSERWCMPPLDRRNVVKLLRNGERSVGKHLEPITSRLGVTVEVPDAVLWYVADRYMQSGTDFRTAAEWVLSAARRRLIAALDDDRYGIVTLTPDDLIPGRFQTEQ